MKNSYSRWHHPYKITKEFDKKTAYFSMDFAVDQGLKTCAGGPGFLSGSQMRSAYDLKQDLIGVGMFRK